MRGPDTELSQNQIKHIYQETAKLSKDSLASQFIQSALENKEELYIQDVRLLSIFDITPEVTTLIEHTLGETRAQSAKIICSNSCWGSYLPEGFTLEDLREDIRNSIDAEFNPKIPVEIPPSPITLSVSDYEWMKTKYFQQVAEVQDEALPEMDRLSRKMDELKHQEQTPSIEDKMVEIEERMHFMSWGPLIGSTEWEDICFDKIITHFTCAERSAYLDDLEIQREDDRPIEVHVDPETYALAREIFDAFGEQSIDEIERRQYEAGKQLEEVTLKIWCGDHSPALLRELEKREHHAIWELSHVKDVELHFLLNPGKYKIVGYTH